MVLTYNNTRGREEGGRGGGLTPNSIQFSYYSYSLLLLILLLFGRYVLQAASYRRHVAKCFAPVLWNFGRRLSIFKKNNLFLAKFFYSLPSPKPTLLAM